MTINPATKTKEQLEKVSHLETTLKEDEACFLDLGILPMTNLALPKMILVCIRPAHKKEPKEYEKAKEKISYLFENKTCEKLNEHFLAAINPPNFIQFEKIQDYLLYTFNSITKEKLYTITERIYQKEKYKQE